MKKSPFLLLLVFVLSLSLMAVPVNADETVDSGTCGENLTWEMDWNGNLTIKGTGDMYHYLVSYGGDKYPSPWYDFREDVTTIILPLPPMA